MHKEVALAHLSSLNCRQLMLSKLYSGTTLIVDRYAFSGAVFTAAKKAPGLDLDWAKVC